MAIIAADNGGGADITPIPQGTHVAICDMVADLGKQRKDWQGQEKIKHEIYIRWELPNERLEWTDKDGNQKEGPRVVGQTYTLSLSERANLRHHLESWRGRAFSAEELKGFDVANLLGKACMVTITHTEKQGRIYANVSSVTGLPKGMPKPESAEMDLILYDSDNLGAYADLPEWLQKRIDSQVVEEPKRELVGAGDDLDDDVPF